ncbi:Frag1/DRAM/Sfk1 family-domain-containing protein [Mycena sanguinolenta]|nr:Frag1/DRAM/Sfk1 family-domain-containing protein [Mycena sanguinolenta]
MSPRTIPAAYVARAHTVLGSAAFLVALFLGLLYHYKKLCKNAVASWPDEWLPSVSATVGDWYPERNIFQILIAFTSGPRMALVFLEYLLHSKDWNSQFPLVIFISGTLRTVTCGGWVYITSYDDGEVHDFFMISYIVLTIPWMVGCIVCAANQTRKTRIFVASTFFLSMIPLVYFYLQHKVHKVPGAYSRYSLFEWSLIALDIIFDSLAEEEIKLANLQLSVGDAAARFVHVGTETAKSVQSVDRRNEPETTTTNSTESSVKPKAVKKSTAKEVSAKGTKPRFAFKLQVPPSWKPFISFTSSVYLSYIFWSIFTSLIPTLFYFSVWQLGIAGHELALLATLSPIFLSVTPLLSWAKTRDGATTLNTLSLLGLVAFPLNNPVHRLGLVFLASATVVLKQVTNWAAPDVEYQSILTALGFLLSSVLKQANHSNNPVSPLVNSESGGYNKIGFVLAALAIYEHHSREPQVAQGQPKKGKQNGKFTPSEPVVSPQGHWLTGAVPLGSLIFILHNLLSDTSTLIAWNWTGYVDYQPRGPVPHLHGSLTFIAQALGFLLTLTLASTDVLSHPLWFAYGSAATAVLYTYKNWLGYIGGLNLAVFIMSVIPVVLQRASAAAGSSWESTGKVYFTAMLVYCLLAAASIWTVAYAFVPGGIYLRERTDIVLVLQMACLSLAFKWPGLKLPSLPERQDILTPALLSYSRITLACLTISSLVATIYRTPTGFPQPFKPGPRIINAGIWTVHFGLDNEGRDSQRLVRNVAQDMELDLLGLLETDLHRVVFGNRDLSRVMVEMGYYVDTGPGPASHTWGCVLLSKFPIINSTHHLLPSPNGELAPAIEAVIDAWGTPVTVIVAHNGQEEDPLDRELQSTELARIMAASYPRPVIFLGYVVTKPHAPRPSPYEILVKDGRVHDIDEDDWDRWCEYILYRGLYRTSYARISRGKVTDTELQIGQFVVPPYGTTVVDDSKEARYLRSAKEDLPEDHWFTMDYYNYHPNNPGHHYQVFGTPLYYKIPQNPPLL